MIRFRKSRIPSAQVEAITDEGKFLRNGDERWYSSSWSRVGTGHESRLNELYDAATLRNDIRKERLGAVVSMLKYGHSERMITLNGFRKNGVKTAIEYVQKEFPDFWKRIYRDKSYATIRNDFRAAVDIAKRLV